MPDAHTSRRPIRILALALVIVALGLRLWLAPQRGHIHDLEQLASWTRALATGNPLAVYATTTANYPPLALLPLWLQGTLYRWLASPTLADSRWLTAWLKLPAILADLATSLVVFRLVARRQRPAVALACAAAYALNPAVWYTSAWWGQIEALYTLPMLLAVAALNRRRTGRSWAWLAAAVLVKPHAAVIAPVLLAASWQHGGWRAWRRAGVAASAVLALVLAPLAWVGQLDTLWAQLGASAGRQLFLTMNAHNLWYLLSGGRGSFAARAGDHLTDNVPLLGPLTGWQIGMLLLAVWTLWVIWRLRQSGGRTPAGRYLLAAGMVLGFFMLPAEAHERYLFPALALLAPTLPAGRSYRWLYALLSLALFLNLLWVDPAVPLRGYAENLFWGLPVSLLALAGTVLLVRLSSRPDPVR